MAAGQQTTSRKRYSNGSKDDTRSNYYRFDQRFSAPVTEITKSSVVRNSNCRRMFVDSDCGRFVRPFDHELQGRNGEVDFSENRSNSGSNKKRKFSPILWDGVDKQLSFSSKKRDLPTNYVLTRSSPSESFNDFGKLQDVVGIKGCSGAVEVELQISPVESLVSNVSDEVEARSLFATSTPKDNDQELEDEEGEYVEERNLFNSKWAFKDSPRMASHDNNSSPESGEFKRDGSEGNEVSSLSVEDGQCVAQSSEDDHMQNVVDKAGSAGMDYLGSDDDDDGHGLVCTGLGMMPSCRNVFEYERLGKISEGTYGVVYKARDKKTGDIVALKKMKMGKGEDGFPVTALREINILGSFQHPSIVEMKEVVMDDFNGVYMVMEHVDHELKGYMERMKQPFSQSEVKCLMLQLLEGLSYLHDNWVIHRDLKTSNLLLNKKGELKICDLGMSRQYGSPVRPYTSLVVTLWYRAPEILLGMKNYTTAIDMWSVGCIMAELLSKKPLFDGNKELEQICKIFTILGTPNESLWPGYSKLPGVKSSFVKQPLNTLRRKFPVATFTGTPTLTELGFDLLSKLLTYDPAKRITAEEALNHGWFREAPLPAEHVTIRK